MVGGMKYYCSTHGAIVVGAQSSSGRLRLLKGSLLAEGLVAEDNRGGSERQHVSGLEVTPFLRGKKFACEEGSHTAIVIRDGKAELSRTPFGDTNECVVTVHTRVARDNRNVGGGILVAAADGIHPHIEGEELLVAEDVLHDDEMPYRRSLLLTLYPLGRGQAQTQVELVGTLRTDER